MNKRKKYKYTNRDILCKLEGFTMFFKKGIIKTLYLLILFVFVLTGAGVAFSSSQCANPAIAKDVGVGGICDENDEDFCCPPDDDSYYDSDNDYYPNDRDDCLENYFGEDLENCEGACCYYADSEVTCNDVRIVACAAENGTPDPQGKSCTETELDGCDEGCCCYEDVGADGALISTETYCEESLQGEFHPDIDDVDACNTECENEPSVGEGVVDPDDVEDDIEPGVACPSDMSLCPSWTQEDSLDGYCCCDSADVVCGPDEYCCDGSCSKVPCDEMCESHKPALDEEGIQMRDENDCWKVYKCQSNGTYADEPTATDDCVLGFEVCHSDSDDTGDGLMNCEDPFCEGQKCADDEEHRYDDGVDDRCMGKGYFDINDGVYRCCGDADRLNNCSDAYDGYDTCGSCDCLKVRTSPVLHEIGVERGTKEVEVKWSHGCEGQVDYSIRRCEGPDCPDEPGDDFIEIEETDSSPYIDEGIEPNTRYCYYVKSNYPGGHTKDSEVECFTSGDRQCMETGLDEFCLDEDYEFGSELVVRARCFRNNTLAIRDNCATPPPDEDSEDWSDKICRGPDQYGETHCVEQEDCERCGEPFRTFADYETSAIELDNEVGAQNLCQYIDNCFYDYSPTSRDFFRMCKEIRTCHDYRSEFACTGQPSSELDSNNPCLPRDCEWEDLDSGGVCLEATSAFNTCDRCENTVFGGIFDVCDSEKCSSFGNCFLRPSDNQCISGEHITCWDYTSQQQCEGGRELYIDVEYDNDERMVGGTHEIINESGDQMGIGLCRWYDQGGGDGFCYKDADFSGIQDDSSPLERASDYNRPETKILTPSLTRDLNISFQVRDVDDRGFSGSGVRKNYIYFCKVEEGEEPCYPESISSRDHGFDGSRGWVDLGGATTGQYTIYYYSKDRANNLERVQNKTMGLDRTRPNITIDYEVHRDLKNYEESNVTFLISTDKQAECNDEFSRGDETWSPDLTGDYFDDSWSTKYEGLSDGFYQYRVECVDEAGNTNFKEINDIRVDADQFIIEPSPNGTIDYSSVELSVKTATDSECRFGEEDEDFGHLPNTFEPGDTEDGWHVHSYDYELENGSGTYSFYVKCQGGGDRISSDGILFVYDNLPPETKVVDHLNDPINFSDYYSGNSVFDSVFLDCEDSPEFGFGCDKTFYCVNDQGQECSPEEEITYEDPINLSDIEDDFMLCYYSVENIKNGMGGLEETIRCDEFTLDTEDPYIEVESDLKDHTDPDNPKKLNDFVVEVSGNVVDPDTISDPDNKLTIVVDHRESGNETLYEDIPANPDFSEMVDLEEGLNEITLSAVDRSGQSSGEFKYFAFNEPYDGEWIELVTPEHGAASNEVFTFEVRTPHTRAEDCRYTFSQTNEPNQPMSYQSRDGSHIFREGNMDFSSLDEGQPTPIRVKCEFGQDPSAEKTFELIYLKSSPKITGVSIDKGLGNRDPPIIVEHPLETNLTVETDQETICKYTQDSTIGYNNPNQNYFSGYEGGDYSETSTVFLSNLEDDKEYTYYIQCENRIVDDSSIRTSGPETFTFTTDTNFDGLIDSVEPESPTPDGVFQFTINTTKSADSCEFIDGPATPNISRLDSKTFESAEVDLESGEHRFEIECLTDQGHDSDNFVIVVARDPPGKPAIYGGNETINKYAMSASWSVHEESFVDIILYEYGIGSSPGETDVLDWHNTTERNKVASDLNLTEGQPYYWTVRAMDEFERWGEANVSGAVYVNPAEEERNCSDYDSEEDCETHDVCSWDDEMDECLRYEPCNTGTVSEEFNETDVDCGGPNCPKCEADQNCSIDDDCVSDVCEDGVCQEPDCEDGVKNQGESDIDCGDPCPPCELGKDCVREDDCISGYCDNGVCAERPDTHVDCSDLNESDCNGDETCIWDDENGTCEDLVCSELEMDECEESDMCEWDEENQSCTDETEGCIVEDGPMAGMISSNCNGIPDAWKEKYPKYQSLKEEYGVDDASDLDFSGDGYTNREAYLNGIDPIEGEEVDEEPSYWFLILMLLLLILILLILIYIGYFKYYDSIPPNVRNYTDKVMLPLRRAVNKVKMKLLELEDKILELMGQKPRKRMQPTRPGQGQYAPGRQPGMQSSSSGGQIPPAAGSRGGPIGGSGTKRQGQASQGRVPATPKRAVITDREVENAETTKEMVDKMRKKRQEEKEKQRKQLLDKFNTGSGAKGTDAKKKNLLEKINNAFGSENEKDEDKENDKNKKNRK